MFIRDIVKDVKEQVVKSVAGSEKSAEQVAVIEAKKVLENAQRVAYFKEVEAKVVRETELFVKKQNKILESVSEITIVVEFAEN